MLVRCDTKKKNDKPLFKNKDLSSKLNRSQNRSDYHVCLFKRIISFI